MFNSQLNYITLSYEFAVWSKNPGELRFGQYIVNKYLVLGQSAPEIFYEEKPERAFWRIFEALNKREE